MTNIRDFLITLDQFTRGSEPVMYKFIHGPSKCYVEIIPSRKVIIHREKTTDRVVLMWEEALNLFNKEFDESNLLDFMVENNYNLFPVSDNNGVIYTIISLGRIYCRSHAGEREWINPTDKDIKEFCEFLNTSINNVYRPIHKIISFKSQTIEYETANGERVLVNLGKVMSNNNLRALDKLLSYYVK